MIRTCGASDFEAIYAIINDAASWRIPERQVETSVVMADESYRLCTQ